MKHTILPLLCCISAFIFLENCSPKKSELVWEQNFPMIGSQSSPRAADLNGDGVLDFVMGAGKNEFQYAKEGVLAFNGKTGEPLWMQECTDQVYGSPTFLDITSDETPDVFIGGRGPHLKALDGKTGKVIWEFHHERLQSDSVLKNARFNFSNSVLTPDQNGDGMRDLLIVNGGNGLADPYKQDKRFPGVLMLLNPKTGDVLAADTMPDGRETYMSPLCFQQPGGEPSILFGSGGETFGGNLYLAKVSDLMAGKLSEARVIATEKSHGFIAPPVLADITGDGFLDIVVISHASNVTAINGKDLTVLWTQQFPDTESSNSFAVGNFTGDNVPDFFTFISKGQWPANTRTLQILLDGKDGTLAYQDSMGCTGFSSPVVYDLNYDGTDEAIISINDFDCSKGFTTTANRPVENRLVYIDFEKRNVSVIDQQQRFKNIFTTPWIGDADNDGYLDIFHCQYFSQGDMITFLGMRARRISTGIKVRQPVLWGAYMGSAGDGIFLPERP